MPPVPTNSRNQQLQEQMAAAVIARQEGEFRRRRREDDSGSSTPVTEEAAAELTKEQLREAAMRKQHNDELRALARQAAEDAARKKRQLWILSKAGVVVVLLAVMAWTSQLGLAPVYGGLPSAQFHSTVVAAGCFVGWAFNEMIRQTLRRRFPGWLGSAQLLPVVAAYVPTMHMLLERRSALFGAWGPLITEIITLLPVAVLSAASVADLLAEARVSDIVPMFLPLWVAESLPGLGAWLLYTVVRKNAPSFLWSLASRSVIFTVVGLQVLATIMYSGLAPSPALVVAGASMLHTGFYNYHLQSETGNQLVNSSLEARGWRLLDREHSITGYISVLENLKDGYRVMRCDHSLLGGEWIPEEGSVEKPGLSVAEPVYGVFAMLEAVRLVHRNTDIEDSESKALVIGLGVGTTPSAFVTHGIKTTVVEIDPVVYKFAQQYFGLRENAPPIIDDATAAMAKLMRDWTVQFDYIVHDVFTGGAEPEELFSADFLADLSNLLADDGVIALNYAGDMTLESTKQAITGITRQFRGCRMFREYPPNSTLIAETGTDFANGVLFCRKAYDNYNYRNSYGNEAVSFREPVREDFLQTYARQQFLKPKHEVNLAKFFQSTPRTSRSYKTVSFANILRSCSGNIFNVNRGYDGQVEVKKPTNRVEAARGHWKIMRTVIPPSVWELW